MRQTHRVGVGLIRLEFLVVGELDVDGSTTQLGGAVSEVVDHGGGTHFIRHLQEGLRKKTHTNDDDKVDAS